MAALKWEKSAISKVQKHIFCNFKKVQKSIFAPEKSPKIPFLLGLNFFLVQKFIFCHFWNCKKWIFELLKLQFFSNFRALSTVQHWDLYFFLSFQILNLTVVVGTFFFTDQFLDMKFRSLGLDWIESLNSENPVSLTFEIT